MRLLPAIVSAFAFVEAACAGHSGTSDANYTTDVSAVDGALGDVPDAPIDALDAVSDTALSPDASPSDAGCVWSAGATGSDCYAHACPSAPHSLQENRDRLIADLARRKCTDSCTLWSALSQAERYVFLMDTAYFGAPSSGLYPRSMHDSETALDHMVSLYSINAPDGSTRGGLDYNRIYVGLDGFAMCVMRNFSIANPTHDSMGNQWQTSDDVAGPHAPFTQREMIFWYRAIYDLQSEGPQWHFWHQDSDFTQSGIDQRAGVCGVHDPWIVESTIAFDAVHNSDPLGDYSGRGGIGWQIVSMHAGIDPSWSYSPSGCSPSAPVNMDMYGGGTFAGRGPIQSGSSCTNPVLGADAGCTGGW